MALAISFDSFVGGGQLPDGGIFEIRQVFTNEPVNGVVNVDSRFSANVNGYKEGEFRNYGIYVQLSGAAPNVKVQQLQSFNDTLANYAPPDLPDIGAVITDTVVHIRAITVVPMQFLRFRLAGQAGNGATTTANLWYFRQT